MNNKGYKAFNPDFTCNGKQYEENTIYEEKGSEICKAGEMHYCENPFDVLNYYPLVNGSGEISEFAEVEPLGKIFRKENKSATNKLRIKAKLGLKGFIKACIDFILEKTIEENENNAENDNGNNSARICSSGNYAKIGSSGNYAQIGSSGNFAKITSEGYHSVVMAAGYNSIARAKKGSWITLAEWNEKDGHTWTPKCVKTEYVDGERIKEDTFYKLVDGEFTELNTNTFKNQGGIIMS